jgi:hypothetical protein
MDATFMVAENFQMGAGAKRVGDIITVSEGFVEQQIKLGKHPKTKKWMSSVLNHCDPVDDFTAELVGVEKKAKEAGPEEIEERISAIQKEFDEIKVAFDRRWKLPRYELELMKAKKERGL